MKVLTIGTFDLLHFGHIAFLQECKKLGDLTVGVNTDLFAESFKRRPIMSQAERFHALYQLGYDVMLNESAGRSLIELTRPDLLAVGSDWARKDYYRQINVDQDFLDQRGMTLAYVPYVHDRMPISTSEIIRRIHDRATADHRPDPGPAG